MTGTVWLPGSSNYINIRCISYYTCTVATCERNQDSHYKERIREIDLVVMFWSGTVLKHVVSCRSIVMTKPRKQQISLEATPFYHCFSRCVRRAFLCGYDRTTGRSFEHRRHQIESDILRLASIFFIDIAAYSVMSNHYHVVLHVDRDKCMKASPKTIAQRWHQMFSGKEVSKKFITLAGQAL